MEMRLSNSILWQGIFSGIPFPNLYIFLDLGMLPAARLFGLRLEVGYLRFSLIQISFCIVGCKIRKICFSPKNYNII